MDNPQAQPEAAPPQASPRSKRKWIALAVGGGCALVALAGLAVALVAAFLYPNIRKTGSAITGAPTTASVPTSAAPAVQQSSNTIGDPNAPVKIVEYADFQCPYCRLYWQDTEPQIFTSYVKTGKVYYEYRSVGGYLGEESQAAAEAAYCAGDQGKFWDYRDTLFAHWTGENVGDFTPEKLQQYAASLGLDQVAFEQCLSSGKMTARVQQDLDNAKNDGIKGTPSFIINGTIIEGAQPFAAFQQAIEQALQGK
jgi:protein-disulfide isomerase